MNRNYGLMVGGVVAAVVAGFALLLNWRRTENDSKRLGGDAVRLENDRRRIANDTYVKAIEQLGSPAMEVRLGAIYALERIAATDRDYHWPIMETLCAYIRERPASKWGKEGEAELPHGVAAALGEEGTGDGEGDAAAQADGQQDETPRRKRPPTDIQAILTIFERCSEERKAWEKANDLQLDLRHADLVGADLALVKLVRADLRGADLMGANLWRADLMGADLMGANLWRAILMGADLMGADLMGANLRDADLMGANLRDADLMDANLMGASFSKHPSELGARWDEANPPTNLDKIRIMNS